MRHRYYLAAAVLSLAACAAAFAKAPQKPMRDANLVLWQGGEGGYATYRIPGIVVTERGTVLAYAAARRTTRSDWADTNIVMRRSVDGGKSFAPSVRIAGDGHGTTDNPVAVVDKRAHTVLMLYQTNYERVFVMESRDDGLTFSAPREITPILAQMRSQFPWTVIAPGPNHGIQMRNGRLVVPIWMAAGAPDGKGHRKHAPSAVTTLYSDDDGRTWKHGEMVAVNGDAITNPNETAVAQLPDGRVMLNIRTGSDKHRRVVTTSPDGASHWTKPRFDEALFDPVCDAGFLELKVWGKHYLLFSNPDSSALGGSGKSFPRKRLTIRLSKDNGQTWPVAKLVDEGWSGYSDLAALSNGTVLLLYESGAIDGKPSDPQALALARFNIAWIEDGSK